MFFTASDFTFTTRHIHNWVLFQVWLNLFSPFRSISPLFSSSILSPTNLGSLSFGVLIFCLFILFMVFSRQECWSSLLCPSPVDHVLLELSTMTHPSWVALHGMLIVSLSYTKLWSVWSFWLVFCDFGFHFVSPLMDEDKRLTQAPWWKGLVVGKTGSCSGRQGHAQYIFNPIFCWWVRLCSLAVVWPEAKLW